MRVLVCGGREFGKNPDGSDNDIELYFLCDTLEDIRMKHPDMVVIQGEARGADRMARRWAEIVGVPVVSFPADWVRYGRNAGPVRNLQMITEGKPDLVVAFRGGAGTRNMIKQALQHEIEVITPCLK